MFLIEKNSLFKSTHQPNTMPQQSDYLFCYRKNTIGLLDHHELPTVTMMPSTIIDQPLYCFGHIRNQQCLLLPDNPLNNLNFIETRYSHRLLAQEFYQAIALGNHMAYWRNNHIYCGECASLMLDHAHERARICPKCHNIVYPKISPCIIVLVTKGKEMLLARSPYFPQGVFSTLAGFIEVGETIEQTVIREVKEEVGINVTNLTYICSQPWPFPDSLMLGFMAKYESGDVQIDRNEIEAADWFNINKLPPQLPNEMSIARHLIELHLSGFLNKR